jgi:hypothetical protein
MEKPPALSEEKRQAYRHLKTMCQFFFLFNAPGVKPDESGDPHIVFTLDKAQPENNWLSIKQHTEDPLNISYVIQLHKWERTAQYEQYIGELVRIEADGSANRDISISRKNLAVFGAVIKRGKQIVPRIRSSQTERHESGELSAERAHELTAELLTLQQTMGQE